MPPNVGGGMPPPEANGTAAVPPMGLPPPPMVVMAPQLGPPKPDYPTEEEDGGTSMHVGCQLASCLVHERIGPQFVELIKNKASVLVITDSPTKEQTEMQTMCEQLGAKTKLLTPDEFLKEETSADQIMTLDNINPIANRGEFVSKLKEFVAEGALVISIGASVFLVDEAFPGKLQGSMKTTKTGMKITLRGSDEETSFFLSAYPRNVNAASKLPVSFLERGSTLFSVEDPSSVQVMFTSKEMSRMYGRSYSNAVVKFSHEKGVIMHLVSQLWSAKKRGPERSTIFGPDKRQKIDYADIIPRHGGGKVTTRIFQTAADCGHVRATENARSMAAFLEFFSKVLIQKAKS